MTDEQSDVERYIVELRTSVFFSGEEVDESLANMLCYYRRQAWHRQLRFRISGIALIVASASLPLLVAFGGRLHLGGWYLDKDVAVATASVLVAILTSLLSFFRWEVGWRGASEALFTIRALEAEWEGALASARLEHDAATGRAMAKAAFEKFHSGTFDVVKGEMSEYFKAAQPPNVRTKP